MATTTKMAKKPLPKIDLLYNALAKGRKLSSAMIQTQFGIANPSATISDIRHFGHTIDLVEMKTKKGIERRYMMA